MSPPVQELPITYKEIPVKFKHPFSISEPAAALKKKNAAEIGDAKAKKQYQEISDFSVVWEPRSAGKRWYGVEASDRRR